MVSRNPSKRIREKKFTNFGIYVSFTRKSPTLKMRVLTSPVEFSDATDNVIIPHAKEIKKIAIEGKSWRKKKIKRNTNALRLLLHTFQFHLLLLLLLLLSTSFLSFSSLSLFFFFFLLTSNQIKWHSKHSNRLHLLRNDEIYGQIQNGLKLLNQIQRIQN